MSEETKAEVSGTSPQKETALTDIGRELDEAGLADILLDKFDPEKQSQTDQPEPEQTAKEEDAEPVNDESSDADASAPEQDDITTSVLSQDDSGDDEPEWFQKRIDKLTRQRRQAEAEVEDLRSELDKVKESVNESKPQPVITGSDNPFNSLTNLKEVEAKIQSARETKKWARANRDGAVVQGDNGEVEYTPEQVEHILNNAEDALEVHLPAQKEFIREKLYWDDESTKEYPWLDDKSSQEYELHSKNLEEFPAIRSLPNHRILIADMMLGQAMRYQNSKTNNKANTGTVSKPKQKAPPQPSAPNAAPAPLEADEARSSAASKRFNQSHSQNDLADVILNNFL